MGMFDSLYVKCPECGAKLEFQTKSGPCALLEYKKNNLHPCIATGMNGDIVRCDYCKKRVKLVCEVPDTVKIELFVVKSRSYDYQGNYKPTQKRRKTKWKNLNSNQ